MGIMRYPLPSEGSGLLQQKLKGKVVVQPLTLKIAILSPSSGNGLESLCYLGRNKFSQFLGFHQYRKSLAGGTGRWILTISHR